MERVNFQILEEKWQKIWENKKLYRPDKKKNFIVLRCFLTHPEKYIWVTLEIIQ